MILDHENLFSNDQAITTTANSTNVIKRGTDDEKDGTPEVLIQVTTTFAGGTSIKVGLYTDESEDMSGEELVMETKAIALASLVAGYKFKINRVPDNLKKYSRLTYTVVGTMSAGKITAGFVMDRQTNINMP